MARVTLNLAADEFVGELRILRQFVGVYDWRFQDRTVQCREVYGSVSLPATEQERRFSLAVANIKLRRRITGIRSRGINVDGADRRFENSESLSRRRQSQC